MSQTNQQVPQKKKKKKKWPLIVLALMLVIGTVVFLSGGKRMISDTAEAAVRRDLTTYYSFSGNLTPVSDEVQTAKDAVKVKELYVKEGDEVEVGTVLLRGTDGTRVVATYEGTLETLYPVIEDQLQAGSQVARIVDYQRLEVSIDVDEYDIEAIEMGKEGTVYLNALGTTLTGTVSEIARNATTEGGVSYYAVKMQVEANGNVRSGMSVEVNILNKQALGAISLPLKVISYDEYNKPFVYKHDAEGKRVPAYVEMGVSDGQNVEIMSGVAEDENVYYRSNDTNRFFAMRDEMMDARSTVEGSK